MKTTTEMQLVSIDKLIPYVNNARTHSPEQIKKLRSSLREFGFINPVIIDRVFNIIAGHGRVMAAKEEGITEVPCVFVDYLTEAQKKAYILADNRMAMDAGWDEELLRIEIESLKAEDFDVELTGFDAAELDKLLSPSGDEIKDDDFDVDAELEKNDVHPTMKPIPLIAYCIMNSSMSNTLVLDPFLGSGTTMMAAEQSDRSCYGLELDPKYCDVIVNRFIELTGSSDGITVERNGKVLTFEQAQEAVNE